VSFSAGPTVGPNKNIGAQPKEKNAISKPNAGGECARVKKPWMIPLQQLLLTVLRSGPIGWFVADFVAKADRLSIIFPGAVMREPILTASAVVGSFSRR